VRFPCDECQRPLVHRAEPHPGAHGLVEEDHGSAEPAAPLGRRPARLPAIALQSTLLVGLFVLADLVPEQLVPALTPVGPLYWATLLAVKNLTVIPFTMIWLIGAVRQALLAPDPEAASPAR
jgi:hypothetical protein